MPNIDNIQDIEIKDIKKDDKEVFSETEISDKELETGINNNLEGLWKDFFQGQNKEELKKLVNQNIDNTELLKQAETVFDTWLDANTNVITGLEFSIFTEKNIDQQKQKALKEYISSSTLDLNTTQVQIELENLKNGVQQNSERVQEYTDIPKYKTTEIIQGTVMYAKLEEEMGRDEAKIEEFGNKIHGVIDKYFQPNLDFLDSSVRDSMNVAIQFSLMEELTKMGSDKAEDFFNAFGKSKKKNNSKMFFHLIESFSIGGDYLKLGNYLKLGKRLENLKRYLSENKSRYGNGSGIQKLTNPVKCKALLQDPNLDEYSTTKAIQFTLGKPEKKENVDISSLQAIADNSNIPITKKIIKKIEKSLDAADDLLDKRIDLYNDVSGTYTSISSAVEGVIQQFKPLAQMVKLNMGGDYLIDFLGKPGGTIRKILDFLLGLIGFTGGLESVHSKYITDNINKGIELDSKREDFIIKGLEYYQNNPDNKTSPQGQTTFDKVKILQPQKTVDEKATAEEQKNSKDRTAKLTDKIPENYILLRASLKEAIKTNPSSLNVDVIQQMGLSSYVDITTKTETNSKGKTEQRKLVGRVTITITDEDKFVDAYLPKIIEKLAKNQKFMNKITSPDDFAFATIGNLVLDHFFVEGIAIGAVERSDYGGQESTADTGIDDNKSIKAIPEYVNGQKLILIDKVKENKEAFQKKVIKVSAELGINPNNLMAVMNLESGLDHTAQNKSTNATGLIQFMPKTLAGMTPSYTPEQVKNMSNLQQLELVKNYYLSNKEKLSDLKSLYLATFFPAALNHQENPSWVFESKDLSAEAVAGDNPGIDMDGDLKITMDDFNRYINEKVIPRALA